jgi:sec-independent protein translocase protein TatA
MHLLVVLVIAMLVLGPKKLPEMGRSLGAGIRQFKGSIDGSEEAPAKAPAAVVAPPESDPTEVHTAV